MAVITRQQLNKEFIKEVITGGELIGLNELKSMRRKLITGCGIYFLFRNNTIVYVGQTTNGLKRILTILIKTVFGR